MNSKNKKTKKESNDYLKINPKHKKKYIRKKNSNLFRNNKIDSNSNYSTLENLTSTNNSIIKTKKESNKKYNLTKKNNININNYYTEVIPYHSFKKMTRNNLHNKTSFNNSYLKVTPLANSSFRNIEAFNTIKKHYISKASFNLKNFLKSKNINKKFKAKKISLTIKNTVINLNMVNSNLIISPYNKNQNKIHNNINTLTNKTSMKQIPKLISKNKITEQRIKINDKTKFIKLKNKISRNDISNSSHNWTKTEANNFTVNKTKKKLEKPIDRIKQNIFNNKALIIFHSTRMDDINKSIKIQIKNKVPITKKRVINSNYSRNKAFSPKFKFTKNTINKEELNSMKLISFQKKNRLLLAKNV